MNAILLNVTGNQLTLTKPGLITGGSEYVDMCMFNFDSEWNDYLKLAVFSTADGDEYTEVIISDRCEIPCECLKKSGVLRIGVVGKNNGRRIMSTNLVSHKITRGANENGAALYSERFFRETDSNLEFDAADDELIVDTVNVDLNIDSTEVSLESICEDYPLYAKKSTAVNGVEYFDFKSENYKKTVVIKSESDFILQACADYIFNIYKNRLSNNFSNYLFSKVRFIIFSGEDYEQAYEITDDKKTVLAAEILTEDISPCGKKLIFSQSSDEENLLKATAKFDCLCDESDSEKSTVVLNQTTDGFADFMSERNHANSCTIVWNSENSDAAKFQRYLNGLISAAITQESYAGIDLPEPFTKHVFWRSSSADDTFTLESSMKKMWISLYKTKLNGSYDITMTGYVLLKSENGGRVCVRPVMYQENVDENLRPNDSSFDVECDITAGVSSVLMNGVIYASYSNENDQTSAYPSDFASAIFGKVTDGDAEIIGYSYTLNAVPTNGNKTEILVPQGLVSDYETEQMPPLFAVQSLSNGSDNNE